MWLIRVILKFKHLYSVRVANELGRGNAKAVKFTIKVLLGTSITIGLFFFILCLTFGKKLAYLFTSDVRVADAISDLSFLLSFSVLLNSVYPVLSGSNIFSFGNIYILEKFRHKFTMLRASIIRSLMKCLN